MTRTGFCRAIAAILPLGMLASASVRADVFVLATQGEVRGELVNREESPRRTYVVKTASGGHVALAADQVVEVRPQSDVEMKYDRYRGDCPNTPEGHWIMAEWCRNNKLYKERDTHLRLVLELDPNHAEARRGLGYSQIGGRWVTQEQVMIENGYVRSNHAPGKWILPQEEELLERRKQVTSAQLEWNGKLKRYSNWLGTDKHAQAVAGIKAIDDAYAVNALAKQMETDQRQDARLLYLEALGRLNEPAALNILVGVSLYDRDEEIRASALDEVVSRAYQPAVTRYIQGLKDKDNAVVNRAAMALGRMKDPTAIDPLINALVVLGEEDPASRGASVTGKLPVTGKLDDAARLAHEQGTLAIMGESQFWQQMGLVDRQHDAQQLYTATMLAQLVGEPAPTIRRWQRQGWLVPTREVRRLAYFDFEEVATARRIQELLGAGMTSPAIGRTLAALARQLPDVKRPLAELSIVVQGKQLLVRHEGGLVEPGGQLRFDFEAVDEAQADADAQATHSMGQILSLTQVASPPATVAELMAAAGQLEEQNQLLPAAEMYRAALAAGGPSAEICFLLAELLYQLHDLPAARERYYMAVEIDEDYVEARANLGCVLAELGELELALNAFQGALVFHDDYEDAHYHLGRTLDALGRPDEAEVHWQAFLRLAPSSPWADEARHRLEP